MSTENNRRLVVEAAANVTKDGMKAVREITEEKPTVYDVKLDREYKSLTQNMKKCKHKRFKDWVVRYIAGTRVRGVGQVRGRMGRYSKILDMGCYNGNVMEHLYYNDITNLEGIEINEVLRKYASKWGKVHGYNLEHPLPIKDKTYDILLQVDIHEHLYNVEQFVKESHRILKDGGLVIIYTSNHQHWTKRLLFLFGYIGYKAFGFGEHHVRFVSHDIMHKWLHPYFNMTHIPRKLPFNNLLKRECWYVCRKK